MPTSLQFEEMYKLLNPKQKEAVDTIEGPVMVVAGPGTGKTRILTLRIANILQKTDTPPSAILAITFTEAGVKAMRFKLREVIGSRADEIRLHTFHGFASSIISEHSDYFPHLQGSAPMTEIEAEEMIRSILKDPHYAPIRPFGNPDAYLGKILKTISNAKKEAWTPDVVRTFAAEEIVRINNDETSKSSRGATKGQLKAEAKERIAKCERTQLFADIYEKYEADKRALRKMDFDDLILEVIVAMQQNELLLRLVQEQFLYILVDEHQDTNDSQNLLVRMIADFFETPNLFVVGDEKQAIYRFQGASVDNFLSFRKSWPGMKVISLDSNYRSHQHILDAGFSLIERNYSPEEHKELRIELISAAKTKTRPIDAVTAGNVEAAEEYMVGESKKMLMSSPDATIAVIVRTNRDVERARSAFERRGVSVAAERGVDVFSHPIGSLFFDILTFLADPSRLDCLAKTFATGLWNAPFEDGASFIALLKSGESKKVFEKVPAISDLLQLQSELDPVSYLIHAGGVSGLTERAVRSPLSMEVWRSLIDLSKSLTLRGSLTNPSVLIAELLTYKASAESKFVKVPTGNPESKIRIMTAHGAKGLEFDYVYMPYATEEDWMQRTRGESFVMPREQKDSGSLEDARRLFYVALTRAKVHVSIVADLLQPGGETHTPVRFVGELDPKVVSSIALPAISGGTVSINSDLKKTRRDELASFAKRMLLERGLSVTALNHFIACPNTFFYKSILKVPEAPSASAEKGNAMHEAIATTWKIKEKDEKTIALALKEALHGYFSRSLLPQFEKKALLAHLEENIPSVAKALKDHFAESKDAAVEKWFEAQLSVRVGNEDVEIKLHGKLDAVVEGSAALKVFDYKTRQPMSANEIKGLTKNATGDYFRQLVFYRLLLELNPRYKGKSVEPALMFVEPDPKGRCPIISIPIETEDVLQLKKHISSLVLWVWSGEIPQGSCDNADCEYCRLAKLD